MNIKELSVKFVTINQVKNFVNAAENMTGTVVVRTDDNYIVSGRSLMGIFALDLSKSVIIECDENNYKDIYDICNEIGVIEE